MWSKCVKVQYKYITYKEQQEKVFLQVVGVSIYTNWKAKSSSTGSQILENASKCHLQKLMMDNTSAAF